MNSILVVNVNWLGDAVFSIPFFKGLKKAYPQSKLTCLCVPRVHEVLKYCPYVDKLIIYDERGKHRFPWRKWKLIRYLRKEKFDAAFLLHRSLTRSLMVYLAGIPLRIGYGKFKGLLTHPFEMKPDDCHRCDYYLKVLEDYGIKIDDRVCELRLNLEDIETVDAKLTKAGLGPKEQFVVFNTGGNWDLKRWSSDSFVGLAQRIDRQFGLRVVFAGAAKDKDCSSHIARAAVVQSIVLAGETTLGESLALYRKAVAVISADTGPLHLAHSVGGNVIGIFGPTRPEITGPRGSGRSQIILKDVGCNKAPCYHLSCTHNVCMHSVTVDDVCEAFKKIIH
ncbi:MAG: lipopolysaccharide heptosyltransferase II [Candidatus Omnitrophica bacterium]|nr:lipopolysaccharide heptosyltransferase II [Candidatus Omnitrophota bacterium]